jgi:hypothetical protein
MSGTIFLIVEDKTDAEVVRAILRAKGVSIRVKTLTSSQGGLSSLVRDLSRLIATATHERRSGDCIAVLHDTDEFVQPDRRLYNRILEICGQHKDVIEVIAHDEIEAWLLADEGLCAWLGVRATNCDTVTKPSEQFKSLVKQKTGRNDSGSDQHRVLQHLDGTGDQHSPSLRQAVAHLARSKRRRRKKS